MLSLTRQERQAILFLITVALVGIGINFLYKKYDKVQVIAGLYRDIGKIDLNTTDKALLKSISGIGETLAQRIIEYGNKQGGFKEIEELKNIKGITNCKYEKLKDSFIIK